MWQFDFHTAWSILWAVIQGLGFYSLIQRPSPCSRPGWVRECEIDWLIDRKGLYAVSPILQPYTARLYYNSWSLKKKPYFLSIKRFHAVQLESCGQWITTLSPILFNSSFFTCVAEGESRSRSAVTPSVCPSVRPSVPKSCHRNSSETTDPSIMKLGM